MTRTSQESAWNRFQALVVRIGVKLFVGNAILYSSETGVLIDDEIVITCAHVLRTWCGLAVPMT
jgi:hypothetical protein